MKAKCPICANWLTNKTRSCYYYNDDSFLSKSLKCNSFLRNRHQYHYFDVSLDNVNSYTSLYITFSLGKYYFNGVVLIDKNRSNNIEIKLTESSMSYDNCIGNYKFNDLCDKNVDILDYNEVYWFFKKEARRWIKLRPFL